MNKNNIIKFIISISLPLLAGFIGSLFTMPAIETWYSVLEKPLYTPPGWVFGPAWTVLYILMGISLFLVWKKGIYTNIVKIALSLFALQLILNSLWSIIFFGLQSPMWAFVNIFVLWLVIMWTIILFAQISRPAALLLIPYIAWVTFAAYLNYGIWILN